MALDGKILYRARTIFEENKKERENAHIRRVQSVYGECPRIRELDNEIRNSVAEVIGIALSRGKNVQDAIDSVKAENLRLQEERKEELLGLGYPEDYLDEKPACGICGDTGYHNGKVCECLMAIYRDEQRKELSKLLKMGVETFESFRLDCYDDTPEPNSVISPRQTMEMIFEYCKEYANSFEEKSVSLLFTGGTGLGKTFLSTAIAKVVSEKGFSVVYEPACDLFAAFEAVQFNRADSDGSEINRYMTCDLLILDDLGTELTTAFTNSALYNLVNTRLVSGKKTIISTNLSKAELRRRYSPQTVSRLEGEYNTLVFKGRDIRLMK